MESLTAVTGLAGHRKAWRKRMNAPELNRLRWQCRRGLLELDLVLERFLERYGERLSSIETLLAYTDNDLLDLIRARTECRDARLAEVVGWLRNS